MDSSFTSTLPPNVNTSFSSLFQNRNEVDSNNDIFTSIDASSAAIYDMIQPTGSTPMKTNTQHDSTLLKEKNNSRISSKSKVVNNASATVRAAVKNSQMTRQHDTLPEKTTRNGSLENKWNKIRVNSSHNIENLLTYKNNNHERDHYYDTSHSAYPNKYAVRVTASSEREDVCGASYTVYILLVHCFKNPSYKHKLDSACDDIEVAESRKEMVVEHRYSEFATLFQDLGANGILLENSEFPKRHWAGRIGNWTPSTLIAPKQQNDLIRTRQSKLDAWLVELCEMLDKPGYIAGDLRSQVIEFLTVSSAVVNPCDSANYVSCDGSLPLEYSHVLNTDNGNEITSGVSIGTKHASRGTEKYIGNPLSFTLTSTIRQATYTVMQMCGITQSNIRFLGSNDQSDQTIPLDLLHQAKGLCFLTVVKGGTGLIIARKEDGTWSPPSAVKIVGIGWGALVGGDITNYLLVLNTEDAVKAFAGTKGSVNIGAELGVAVGPVGRGATGNWTAPTNGGAPASVFSYAHSKGLFAGISLEGSIITSRPDVNAKFYGQSMHVKELLFGTSQKKPRACQPLYDALDEAISLGVPKTGFRPSQMNLISCNGSAYRDIGIQPVK